MLAVSLTHEYIGVRQKVAGNPAKKESQESRWMADYPHLHSKRLVIGIESGSSLAFLLGASLHLSLWRLASECEVYGFLYPSRAASLLIGVGKQTVCIPLRGFAIQGMVMVDNRCAIAGTNIKMQLTMNWQACLHRCPVHPPGWSGQGLPGRREQQQTEKQG